MHAFAQSATLPIPPSGVIGVQEAMLSSDYWIAKLRAPDTVLMSRAQIDAQNQHMFEADPSMYDLRRIGPTLSHAQVETWIRKVSKMPGKTLLDEHDQPIPAATLNAMASNVAFDTIPAQATARSITK